MKIMIMRTPQTCTPYLSPYNIAVSAWNAITVGTNNQLSTQHAHTGSLILASSYMHMLTNQTIHEDKRVLNATYRYVVTVKADIRYKDRVLNATTHVQRKVSIGYLDLVAIAICRDSSTHHSNIAGNALLLVIQFQTRRLPSG